MEFKLSGIMKTNKKILGAKITVYNNIKFLSKLECDCYKLLENSGLLFWYEPETITLVDGFYPNNINIYAPSKKLVGKKIKYGKCLSKQTGKIRKITYTPDFKVEKDNCVYYFDAKGQPNDTYPIRKKLFLNYLETLPKDKTYYFIEPHSLSQMKEAINIIKL